MIHTQVSRTEVIPGTGLRFQIAYEFLRTMDPSEYPEGEFVAVADGIRVCVNPPYETKADPAPRYERHRLHFDIQYILEGEEAIDIAPADSLERDSGYNEEADIEFFKAPETATRLVVRGGELCVLSPEEAHRPGCAAAEPARVRKVVAKVLREGADGRQAGL